MTQLSVVGSSHVSGPEDADVPIWERQTGETERAHKMFQFYLSLGVKRSQVLVGEQFNVSRQYVSQLSSKHRWTERLTAWTKDQDRRWFEEMGEERRVAMKRHANIAGAMMGVVAGQHKQIQEKAAKGELTPNELARWVEVATKIEMLALGGATERVESEIGERTGRTVSEFAHQILADPKATEAALDLLDTVAGRPAVEAASGT